MADPLATDSNPNVHPFHVEVRRSTRRRDPVARLGGRWRQRTDRRRAARAERKAAGDERLRWHDVIDVPFGDDPLTIALSVLLAAVLLVVAAPFLWILALFVVDLLVWFVVTSAGLAAWVVLGRPWYVVVADQEGTTVASASVPGRRRARDHAAVVRARLAAGSSPDAAVLPSETVDPTR